MRVQALAKGVVRERLEAKVPVGESGTGSVPSVGRSNSLIRIYAFERQHVAGQRIRARLALGTEADPARIQPKVRLHVTLAEGAAPVAAGGRTRTELSSGDGTNRATLSEDAVVRGARELFVEHPALAYGDGKEGVPQFFLLDAFLGRTFIEQARKLVEGIAPALGELFSGLQQGAPASIRESLDRIAASVGGLEKAGRRLREDAAYRLGKASTSDGTDLTLKATATDGVGSAPSAIQVLLLARSHEVSSKDIGNPGDALGLSGFFRLAGVKVPVASTDDLYALARRINLGEDLNANGRLDGAEDRNFNLALDPREDANQNGLLDTAEDIDGDDILDKGEDLNLNNRIDTNEDLNLNFKLDGSTGAHGVEARVLTGRLYLRRGRAGPDLLEVSDPDGILASLGLVRTDYNNQLVFANPVQAPAAASLVKDGTKVTLGANVTRDLLKGVDLELRREGGAPVTVRVERDASGLVSDVKTFVGEFNRVVQGLNGVLDGGGTLAREPRAQRFRRELERATQDPLRSAPAGAGGAGLSPQSTRDEAFSELQVRELLGRIQKGLQGVFDGSYGVPTVARRLSQLGIVGQDDDTLSLDEDKLREALAKDPAAVKSLLQDPASGIAARVEAALQAAADPESGSLQRLGKVLGGLDLRNLTEGLRGFQKAQTLQGPVSGFLAVA